MKEKLLRAIEEKTGLSMRHNNDFITLSNLLFDTLHKRISSSTLKRIWGYVSSQGVKPRPYTLDTLANYLGATNFADFSSVGGGNLIENNSEQSCISFAPFWDTNRLAKGAIVIARWKPNRRCVLRHIDDCWFEVIEAENCKIAVGDTFACDTFMNGQALQVYNLTHKGIEGLSYIAGKVDGVTYEVKEDDDEEEKG